MRFWLKRFGFAVLCLSLTAAPALGQELRTFTPDDLFRIEEIGDVAISPDGQLVAYVLKRPRLSARDYQLPLLNGNDHADVWLAAVAGGRPMNLTHGDLDGNGYWAPTWSPDNKRLAMLSTKGGDNVWLWIWERDTGRLTKLSERGVAKLRVGLRFQFGWVDNHRLIAVLLQDADKPRWMSEHRVTSVLTQGWSKARTGRESTANVVESGVTAPLAHKQQLTLVDIDGTAKSLGSIVEATDVRVSPDGRHVACVRVVDVAQAEAETTWPIVIKNYAWRLYGGRQYELATADIGRQELRSVASGSRFAVLDSFTWSHDGDRFAFIGIQEGKKESSINVFHADVNGSLNVVSLPGVEPQSVAWASGHRLLVSGIRNNRVDWWLVSPNRALDNLTEHFKTPPAALVLDGTGNNLIGIADGKVWRFNLDSGQWSDLAARFEGTASSIAWPATPKGEGFAHIMVSVLRDGITNYYSLDTLSGATTRLGPPSDDASLAAYSPTAELAVFAVNNRTGSYLTLVHNEQHINLSESNTFLSGIAEGELRPVMYRSLDGQDLKAWLILPTNYQAGKRYPLVTWVYAGTILGSSPPSFDHLNSDSPLNLQLFASRGYAVLWPSMPLASPGPASDPYMELMKAVLPAVDKVIEMGVADPGRVAVAGQSYGGYSTYGLITQTNRFRAAIALGGFSDLTSGYGVFHATYRYDPLELRLFGPSFWPAWAESGQGRMGKPPWKDWNRYARNSPLLYVDHIQTPLLILQGDLDVVPIQQGEEIFTMLYRQDKRARFVRYLGEGHVLDSPANIRDMWMQIYAWLDEFCDNSRDDKGNLVFNGANTKSRNGAPPLKPEDFARFNEMEVTSHPWVIGSADTTR